MHTPMVFWQATVNWVKFLLFKINNIKWHKKPQMILIQHFLSLLRAFSNHPFLKPPGRVTGPPL